MSSGDDFPMMVCFQFVTKGGAVINSEPEPFTDIKTATMQAKDWADMQGKTLALVSYDGLGVVIKTDELEHVTVMPEAKMAEIYAPDPNDLAAPADSPDPINTEVPDVSNQAL